MLNTEYQNHIHQLSDSTAHDRQEITSNDGVSSIHWEDVLAVFSAKVTGAEDGAQVVSLDDAQVDERGDRLSQRNQHCRIGRYPHSCDSGRYRYHCQCCRLLGRWVWISRQDKTQLMFYTEYLLTYIMSLLYNRYEKAPEQHRAIRAQKIRYSVKE